MTAPTLPLAYRYVYLAAAYARFLLHGKCPSWPLRIHVQTHSYCNAACATCPYPETSKNLVHGEMSWEVFDKLVKELRQSNRPSVVLFDLQHEPLLNPELFSWIRHLKRMAPLTRPSIITNGSLLDRFDPAEIVDSGVDRISVSLNAHSEETYARLGTGLDFASVKASVISLSRYEDVRRRLLVSFVASDVNKHEIGKAVAYWNEMSVATQVKPLTNRAGTLGSYDSFFAEDAMAPWQGNRLGSMLRRVSRRAVGCPLPFHQTAILFTGDVLLCCQDWQHDPIVGNVANDTLRNVWNSDCLSELRSSILARRYDRIAACTDCSLAT